MKKFIVALLLIITLILGAGAIYLGYKLQKEPTTAPKESEAACSPGCGLCDDGSCNQCCDGGSKFGTCMTDSDWTSGWFACNQQPGEGGGCTITTISSAKDSFTFSSGCTNASIKRYTRSYDGVDYAFYPNCITDDNNGSFVGEESAGAGSTYTVGYTPGICEQIDAFNNGGFLVGVCRCNPRAPICNESCDSSRTCASGYSCINGVCRNPSCSDETDCTCPNIEPSCGDGNIDPNEQCDPGANPTGCSTNQVCSNSCLCEDVPDSCGNGVIDSNEQCDPNASPTGCASGYNCNNVCQCVVENLPTTAILDTSDSRDQLLIGVLGIISGILVFKINIRKIHTKVQKSMYKKPFIFISQFFLEDARIMLQKQRLGKFEKRIIEKN